MQLGLYAPEPETPTGQARSLLSGFAKVFSAALTQAVSETVASQWPASRASLVVRHAQAIVDGRTATEIIEIAENERQRANEAALAIYREQLATARAALGEMDSQDTAAAEKANEQDAILSNVLISKPKFYFQKSRYQTKPIISFTVENATAIPIKRIFIHGKVQTPGRAIPWADDDFNYSFPGGLEPGEKQDLSLTPNSYDGWDEVPEKAVNGSVLDLEVIAIEDAAGQKIGRPSKSDLAERKKALENGIRDLEEKIMKLESAPAT